MKRRARRRAAGLGVAGLALGGCAPGRAGTWAPRPTRTLGRPRVGWERVIRTVVGLRPYRPGGFVVRTERLDGTLVVHNYGHGGGGITLSWGTADLAVREVRRTDAADVAVLGCGAVGLATARLLQRRGRQVRIYARDLPPETTSNVAGAQWTPFSVFDEEEADPAFLPRFREATRLAYRHFQDLLGSRYAVRWVDNYYVRDEPVELPPWMTSMSDVFPDVEPLPPSAHPFPFPHCTRVRTMFVEPTPYLRAMMEDVRAAGASIEVRELRSVEEVRALPERVVVNCTGLGSRALFGDEELRPVKGQLTVLEPQPEVDYLLLAGGLYMFPRSDGILLGGTFQEGEWSLEPDREAERRIVDGHRELFAAG